MDEAAGDDPLARYRPWFYAAAVYNLVWGVVAILFPTAFFRLIGMPESNYPPLWQVIGMFVMAYAPAYWWAGRRPTRHRHLIVIGLLGKVLGPLGFAWSAATGHLPLAFGLTILSRNSGLTPSWHLRVEYGPQGRVSRRAAQAGCYL